MRHSVDTEELARLYLEEHLTGRQIAARTGIPNRTVLRYLHKAGVPLRNPGHLAIGHLQDRAWLVREYVELGKSTTQIAAELGCSSRSVAHRLSAHGIKARPTGAPKGHSRNSSEAVRAKHSKARRGRFIGADNPNWKGGVRYKDPDRSRYQNKAWVKAVKDRDGWQCTSCGATDRLHAHHVKRWKDYPELRYEVSNGVTLCHTCHEAAHGRGFKFRWIKVRQKPTSAPAPQGA